jgi:exosortase/archaeosortase family protein
VLKTRWGGLDFIPSVDEKPLHQGFGVNKKHFLVGFIISLVTTLLVAMDALDYWWFMAKIISIFLSFAGVEFKLFLLGTPVNLLEGIPLFYHPAGPTFEFSVDFVFDASTVIAIILIIMMLSFLIYRSDRVALPIKSAWLLFTGLIVSTLLYLLLISPTPPHRLNWVTIDWSCSGVVILALITFIFTPYIFTVKGPLWIKLLWLASLLGFSAAWNIVRLSLTMACLYYFGDLVFLVVHYLAGVFVDFIYIVTFYSLALGHLAKHEVSETGW